MRLNRCPYCGRRPFDGGKKGEFYVRCSDWACAGGLRTYRFPTEEQAAEDWNELTEKVTERMRKEGVTYVPL